MQYRAGPARSGKEPFRLEAAIYCFGSHPANILTNRTGAVTAAAGPQSEAS